MDMIFLGVVVVFVLALWAYVKVSEWRRERDFFKDLSEFLEMARNGKWSVPAPLPDKKVCYGAGGGLVPGAVCKNGAAGLPKGSMWDEISDNTLKFNKFFISDPERCRIAIAILSGCTYRDVQREFPRWHLTKSEIYTITRKECRKFPPYFREYPVRYATTMASLRSEKDYYIPLLEGKNNG